MKKVVKLFVVLFALAMLSVSCSHYVCPAYAVEDDAKEEIRG